MPELPEVQTVVNDLNKKIKGSSIINFWTDWEKAIKKDSIISFKKKIKNRKIRKVERKAKNILIYLDDGQVMLVHLKMTGHLLIKSQIQNSKFQINPKSQNNKFKTDSSFDYFSERVNQYIHHVWTLKKGKSEMSLEFSDLRKFGKIQLFGSEEELLKEKNFLALGVEPLDKKFDLKKFKELLEKKSKMSVRNFLMDQKIIGGIGNIYASEIMFEAKIHPQRRNESLSDKEIRSLLKFIKKILQRAIELRGTSDSDYRDTSGAPGGFQKVLKVYNRERKACKRKGCDGIIKRKKFNQRSAYFCDKCQK